VLAPPAGGAPRQPRTRIGLINLTRVIKASKKFQAMEADLRAQTRQAEQKLEVLKAQVQRCQAYSADPATPASGREQSESDVRRLRREMEDEELRAKKLMTKLQGDALTTIYRDVEDAANRVAQAQDLELVLCYSDIVTEADRYKPENLERKISRGALVPMIVSPGMDISDSVIQALNLAYGASGGPRK
jgi:Skp family chaperone for outer membrane proteins